jgi:hypothetical protein
MISFRQFVSESKTTIKENEKTILKFTDSFGEHTTQCVMKEYGWGSDRSKIFHRFKIMKSDSDRYPVGAEFDLVMDFDGKENCFLFYPNYGEKFPSLNKMKELTYTAHINKIK